MGRRSNGGLVVAVIILSLLTVATLTAGVYFYLENATVKAELASYDLQLERINALGGYDTLIEQGNQLRADIELLTKTLEEDRDKLSTLTEETDKLNEMYAALEELNKQLESNSAPSYDSLKNSYSSLKSEYDSLKEKYDLLQKEYGEGAQ